MDIPLLLSVEIPEGLIYAIGSFLSVTVGPGVVLFLKWAWSRELQHQSERKIDMKALADLHAAAMATKDATFVEALKTHAAAHASVLKQVEAEYDEERGETRDRYKTIIDGKDAKIEDLSKEISRKSDQHAAKIEELMLLALAKVEALNDKNYALHDKTGAILNEFVTEVRRILKSPPGTS